MNTEDHSDSEAPDWAYPLLRLLVVGILFEIGCTAVILLFARSGFIADSLEPVVDYFVVGAAISAAWAACAILWYLRIRRRLSGDGNS